VPIDIFYVGYSTFIHNTLQHRKDHETAYRVSFLYLLKCSASVILD